MTSALLNADPTSRTKDTDTNDADLEPARHKRRRERVKERATKYAGSQYTDGHGGLT